VDAAHLPVLLELAKDKYSTSPQYEGDNARLPIARGAVAALAKYAPLSGATAKAIRGIVISTDDYDLRAELCRQLATNCGKQGQEVLFELATTPGRSSIRTAAASGLLWSLPDVSPRIVTKITADLLATQINSVAARLSILLGACGEASLVKSAAQELAANLKQRVLILLLIRLARERDAELAQAMAEMLPSDHPAMEWALEGENNWTNDQRLSDLGDPGTCREVFIFMRPKKS
jgi:hypothetical protein